MIDMTTKCIICYSPHFSFHYPHFFGYDKLAFFQLEFAVPLVYYMLTFVSSVEPFFLNRKTIHGLYLFAFNRGFTLWVSPAHIVLHNPIWLPLSSHPGKHPPSTCVQSRYTGRMEVGGGNKKRLKECERCDRGEVKSRWRLLSARLTHACSPAEGLDFSCK